MIDDLNFEDTSDFDFPAKLTESLSFEDLSQDKSSKHVACKDCLYKI